MRVWRRLEDWSNLVLGAYLFLVPFLFGTTGDAASSWNAYLVGTGVVVVALCALAAPGSRVAEWTNVVLGAWLAAAPFVLGFAGITSALWNALIVGALVVVLAAVALARMGRSSGSGSASGTSVGGNV
jgi:hypothetical protein